MNENRLSFGLFRASDIAKNTNVCCGVARARELGGLIYFDLREREGIV